MKLKDVIKYSKGKLIGEADLEIDVSDFCIDSRAANGSSIFVPLRGEKADGHEYIKKAFENGAVATFTSKDIDCFEGKAIIKVDDTLEALQNTAKNYRDSLENVFVVALTGSVGKTTTKDMIYAVLSKKYKTLKTQGNFNNGIGLPLTILSHKDEECMVLEMGMNSLGEISLLSNIAMPDTSVIINVGSSHIGNLGSRENILKAKMEIIDGMSAGSKLVLNRDNDMLSTVENISQNIIGFGYDSNTDVVAYDICVNDFFTAFKVKENGKEFIAEICLSGKEFVHNALAAWTIGRIYGVSPEDRIDALKQCEYTKMRMNVEIINGYTIIDDCYNACGESIELALGMLARQNSRKVAILGDVFELGDFARNIHEEIGDKVAKNLIDVLVVSGEFADCVKKGAVRNGMSEEKIFVYKDVDEICENIKNIVENDDAILVKASRAMRYEKVVAFLKEIEE